MKITIEQYDHKITYEVPYNDVGMDAMLEILERLLKATGYCFSGNLEIVDDSVEDSKEYPCLIENGCDGVMCYTCLAKNEFKNQ